jgi:ribosomal protein L22
MSDEPENIEEPDEDVVETDATDAEAADVAPTEAEDTPAPDAGVLAEAQAAAAQARAEKAADADAAKAAVEVEETEAGEAVEEPAGEVEQTEAGEAPEPEAADVKPEVGDEAPEVVTPVAKSSAQPSVPTRRRDQKRDPNAPKPVVRAQAKYVRSSARKARLVCDNFRGKSVEEARAILAVTPRHVARDWSKLLESAVANAEHNHELDGETLVIKAVKADEGPTIKRFQPRAQGRATRIRKRTSHLTILLTPKD